MLNNVQYKNVIFDSIEIRKKYLLFADNNDVNLNINFHHELCEKSFVRKQQKYTNNDVRRRNK